MDPVFFKAGFCDVAPRNLLHIQQPEAGLKRPCCCSRRCRFGVNEWAGIIDFIYELAAIIYASTNLRWTAAAGGITRPGGHDDAVHQETKLALQPRAFF